MCKHFSYLINIFSCIIISIFFCSCFTKLARDYTFPDDYKLEYPEALSAMGVKGDKLIICLKRGGETQIFEVGIEKRNTIVLRPFREYRLRVLKKRKLANCSFDKKLNKIPITERDLILPGKGVVLHLPTRAGRSGRLLPIYRGPPLREKIGNLKRIIMDSSNYNLFLYDDANKMLVLKPHTRLTMPRKLRSLYAFEGALIYLPVSGIEKPPGADLTKISFSKMEVNKTLLIYYNTNGGYKIQRAFYYDKLDNMTTFFIPYYGKKKIPNRIWGLCLFPPAVVLDIVTGIIQIIYYIEETKKCLP